MPNRPTAKPMPGLQYADDDLDLFDEGDDDFIFDDDDNDDDTDGDSASALTEESVM